jgi:type IV fimbrial biogenesis protein FimT
MKTISRGVTLIELAVVLAIVAVLLSQAAPQFAAWTQNVQIRTSTESIQNGLQLARSEAIRRNRNVMFWLTSTANPKAADWLVGCMNPINSNGPGPVAEAPGDCPGAHTAWAQSQWNWIQYQTATAQQTSAPQVTAVDANGNATAVVTFNSLGMVLAANFDGTTPIAQIDVAIPSMPASLARPLRITASGGQIRMCDPNLTLANDPRGC